MIAVAVFAVGLAALLVGAELIVRGGSRLAARLGVPPIVIGLTVVSVGTSAPELAVGIDAALRGNDSLAIGNIAGTNTVNILLILGLSALLQPLAIQMATIRYDLPIMTVVAVALLLMASDGALTRTEGAAMLGAALLYSVGIVRWARREDRGVQAEFAREYGAPRGARPSREIAWSAAALIAGIAVIVTGSDWLVRGAVEIARAMDISEAVIGLTIVAIGTSSPELVTTIVGTLRNDRDIAIGNLLGSSIYNILLILGVTCVVPTSGLKVERELLHVDIPVMAIVAIVCVPIFLSGRRVTRVEGAAFVAAYIVYLTYLVAVRAGS